MSRRLKKYFFSGLAVFLPVVLTIYVSIWILNFAESLLGKYLKPFFLNNYDFYFWGLGIILLVALILASGFLITNYFGRQIHAATERALLTIPIMNSIYPAFKEIARFIFRDQSSSLEQVVLIEWPRKDAYVIAFLTNTSAPQICDLLGRKMCNVLVPSVPNPLSGFIILVPEEDIIPLKMTVDEAVKVVVSGGVVTPLMKS